MRVYLFLALILCSSFANAICTQNEMSGKWWVVANNNNNVVRCLLYFDNTVFNTNKSYCVGMPADGSAEIEFKFLSGSFDVNSECRVKVTTVDEFGSTDAGYGYLSRDGEMLNFGLRSSDGSVTSGVGTKIY